MAQQKRHRERDELPEGAPIWAVRINQCLIEARMTQKHLALESGVSEAAITSWLGGRDKKRYAEPKAMGLKDVANALNVSTDYLLGITEIPTADTDIKAICEYTGLTSKAVEEICFSNGRLEFDVMDYLIRSARLRELASYLRSASRDIWMLDEALTQIKRKAESEGADKFANFILDLREKKEFREWSLVKEVEKTVENVLRDFLMPLLREGYGSDRFNFLLEGEEKRFKDAYIDDFVKKQAAKHEKERRRNFKKQTEEKEGF